MKLARQALALIAWSACAPLAWSQSSMTDLIPHRAAAAVTIRNLDELKKKGDRLVKEAELEFGPIRPSEFFTQIYNFLGLQGGIDDTGTAAIILLPPEKKGDSIGLSNLEELLLGALPIADLDKMATN